MERDELEELKQKAKFLSEYKKRLEEGQKKKEEILKLQQEIDSLVKSGGYSADLTVPAAKALRDAKKNGTWVSSQDTDASDPAIEQSWKQEQEVKRAKEKKSEVTANQTVWGLLGIAAFFIPFFWPFFLVQTFRAYPATSWTTLAVVTALIIILFASIR